MSSFFFQNYYKIALRNLSKRKTYSLINIFGLVLGFTCCLLIFQFVAYERSYDGHIREGDRLYRLRLDLYRQGTLSWKAATIFPGTGPAMKEEIPEIESFCRLLNVKLTLTNADRNVRYNDQKTFYTDQAFLKMFDVKMLKGTVAGALDAPDKVILSASTAKIYFENQNPVGKTLRFKTKEFDRNLLVTGVFEDLPSNSHLRVNQLISYTTLSSIYKANGDSTNMLETSWGWYDFFTYFKLKPGVNVAAIQPKLDKLCDKFYNSRERQRKNNLRIELHTIPVSDIHLHSKFFQEAEANGDARSITFLFLISFLIITVAWINYVNLAMAKSLERAKEVGVRKVLGAEKSDLIKQFMMESCLINASALLIAIVITLLLTGWFREFTGIKAISIGSQLKYWLMFLGIFVLGTLISGIYPSLILSNFKPILVLKGAFKNKKSGRYMRKGLIIWQFATSIILITVTLVVFRQVKYMRNKSLGINIERTIVLDGSISIQDTLFQAAYPAFKADITNIAGVKSITSSTDVVGKEIFHANLNSRIGSNDQVTLYSIGVDYDFISGYHLKLIAGRNFSRDHGDANSVIINEEALKQLNFAKAEDALNQQFISEDAVVNIVGVLKNYHHESLQKVIPPILMRLEPEARNYYSIKIESDHIPGLVAKIDRVWSRYFPNDPFSYYFLDDAFNAQYKADEKFGKVFNVFSMLSIFISCIGLLGLSAFNVIQRVKEIAIRKILGATAADLIYLLSREFLVLVLIGFCLATPVAWWITYKWLQNFAYSINVPIWLFPVSGLIMLIAALATVWSQTMKAISVNPLKNLRSE